MLKGLPDLLHQISQLHCEPRSTVIHVNLIVMYSNGEFSCNGIKVYSSVNHLLYSYKFLQGSKFLLFSWIIHMKQVVNDKTMKSQILVILEHFIGIILSTELSFVDNEMPSYLDGMKHIYQ